MIIDTHCHIDLYDNPIQIANECENDGIITIGMTNLPSHFEMGYKHLLSFKKVRLALGMHPLYAESHKKELNTFVKNLPKTSYVGEIGLDFSREGFRTKDIQLETFKFILSHIQQEKKILSIHSRQAEKEILTYLLEYNIPNAIFHWYSGPITLVKKIIEAGYYFSINPAMIKSKSGKDIINKIPIKKILTESDGPFISIKNRPIHPSDIKEVINYLSALHSLDKSQIETQIEHNFKSLLNSIK